MAVTLPAELAGLLAMTGQRWPDADEDQLVAMADGWKGLRDRLVTVRADNSRAVQEIVAGNQSQAVSAVRDQDDEFDWQLQQLIEVCARVEAILISVARAVFDAKKAITEALAEVARTIADWKNDADDIPVVGWLFSEAIETFIEEPVAALSRVITWIVERLTSFILDMVIPRLVEPIRLVKGIVENLRRGLKLDLFEDWPTTPSSPPHPAREPGGNPKTVDPKDKDAANIRATGLENAAAVTLAQAGYDIEQLAERKNQKNPDFRIEGKIFDAYSPTTANVRNIWTYVKDDKVNAGQADRVIINLDARDAQADVDALREQFQNHLIPGLEEAKVIAPGGAIIDIYP